MEKPGRTGEMTAKTHNRFWSGRKMEYRYGDMRGNIVLRLVPCGEGSGGVLFMDHTLIRN